MQIHWNDKDPIYRQLHDKMVELIIDGTFDDGDALPSIRQLASDHRINPITVSKAMLILVDEEFVEKRRGLGMFVRHGARQHLKESEQKHFLETEWPEVCEKINRLGLSREDLLNERGI